MTEQQIKKRLKKICEDYLKTVPQVLHSEVEKEMYIAGGCISSMLLNEPYSDYDVFFTTKETADAVRMYYCKQVTSFDRTMKVVGEEETNAIFNGKVWMAKDETYEYGPLVITENAITLKNKIQLITKFYGPPGDVVERFDFKHLRAWYSPYTDNLVVYDYVYKLLVNKMLVYTGSDYPINSMSRADKYIKKGWHSSPLMKVAMLLDVNQKVDLTNIPAVLKSAAGIDPNSELARQIAMLQDVEDAETLIKKIEYL